MISPTQLFIIATSTLASIFIPLIREPGSVMTKITFLNYRRQKHHSGSRTKSVNNSSLTSEIYSSENIKISLRSLLEQIECSIEDIRILSV